MKNITRKLAVSLFILSLATATIKAGEIQNPSVITPPPPPTSTTSIGTTAPRMVQIRVADSEYLEQLLPALTQALVALF